jgi:flagellar motor switch protein FliG
VKVDGFKEALEMLKGLDTKTRSRILEDMAIKDPELVEALRSQLINLKDLVNLTPLMMRDLLSAIDPYTLGIALRTEDDSIAAKLITMMSKNMASELEEGRSEGLKPLSEVQKVQAEVLDKINSLAEQGKLVLKDDDEYV